MPKKTFPPSWFGPVAIGIAVVAFLLILAKAGNIDFLKTSISGVPRQSSSLFDPSTSYGMFDGYSVDTINGLQVKTAQRTVNQPGQTIGSIPYSGQNQLILGIAMTNFNQSGSPIPVTYTLQLFDRQNNLLGKTVTTVTKHGPFSVSMPVSGLTSASPTRINNTANGYNLAISRGFSLSGRDISVSRLLVVWLQKPITSRPVQPYFIR